MVLIKRTNSPFRLQSAQSLFSGLFNISLRVFAWRSVTALSCRDMMVVVHVEGGLEDAVQRSKHHVPPFTLALKRHSISGAWE